MYDKQPQSYAEMFQIAMWELEKRTDEYFKWKEKQFDEYMDRKIQERLEGHSSAIQNK